MALALARLASLCRLSLHLPVQQAQSHGRRDFLESHARGTYHESSCQPCVLLLAAMKFCRANPAAAKDAKRNSNPEAASANPDPIFGAAQLRSLPNELEKKISASYRRELKSQPASDLAGVDVSLPAGRNAPVPWSGQPGVNL